MCERYTSPFPAPCKRKHQTCNYWPFFQVKSIFFNPILCFNKKVNMCQYPDIFLLYVFIWITILCLSRGCIKSLGCIWNLSNRDHGQGRIFGTTITTTCIECHQPYGWMQTSSDFFAPFYRLFFTRTNIFKVVVMSAAMTARTCTLTSAVVTPSEWRAAVSWSMSVPITWATSITWKEASIPNTRDGWASVALYGPVAWFQRWAFEMIFDDDDPDCFFFLLLCVS